MPITRNLRRLVASTSTPTAAVPPPTQTGISSPWTTGSLTSVVWADIVDTEALPSTRAEAMAVPAVARSRHVLCTTIGRFALRAYRGETQLPDTAQPAWITRTDQPMSAYHRMLWTVDDLLFGGWSLWLTDLDSEGAPLAARRVLPDHWHFDDQWRVVVTAEVPAGAGFVLLPGPHEGILNYGRRTVRAASRLEHAAAVAADTPHPTIELHDIGETQLNPAEIEQMKTEWRAARQAGSVGYTSKGVELKTHGAHPENLLTEGRNASAVDVARMVGLPASAIDATPQSASLTYSTTETRNRELVDYGLAGYMSAISARLSLDDVTPRGQRVAFDLEEFLPVAPLSAGGDNQPGEDPES